MYRARLIRIGIVLAAVALGLVLWAVLRPAAAVTVVRPVRRNVVELVIASGSLQAVRQSDVGTQVTGTVEQVLVREGAGVVQGQVLIILERGEALQQVEQARLAVQTARNQLEVARRPAQAAEISRARAELAQARRVGAARVEQARQQLARLQRGGRPEDIARAEAALRQARASLQQAQLDFQRTQQLFDRGAVSRAELDRARTALNIARENVSAAEQQVELARQPATAEEIAAARAELQAAQANLEESVRAAQQSLQLLLDQPRPEDVRVAQARVDEAASALRQAELQAARRVVRAPLPGVVTTRNVEPGQSVTPGTPLLTIADMRRTEVVVETDETNLPRLRVGQPVILIAPAYPDRPFRGTLTTIGPEIDAQRGVVPLRIRPTALPDFARPDLTVDVNIEVARIPDALSVPVTSLVQEGGRTYVMVVDADQARRREVRVLARGEDYAAVEGIQEDTPVILRGAEVRNGQKVRVRGGA